MGGNSSKGAPTYYTNESEKSARNVLENFAKDIKGKASNDAKKKGISLKGYLRQAKFYHEYSKHRNVPENPCNLNYIFHTNVWHDRANDRDPCLFSRAKRFSNEGEAECGSDKIRDNGERSAGGACAPYRRRYICDYNLHHINENNIRNTHDLLGNVLVTAKYEGESIVKNHPNRGSSEVCTALARSFADIGDIVRGKDLFLGGPSQEKKKLEERLKTMFENIKKNNYSTLKDLSLEQVREYWWALNRNDVWEALTCNAPTGADYFVYKPDSLLNFSSDRCGHNNNDGPLTNLDYVPQFLRWFEEWAE
ncbi:hypothetical protein PFFCH_02842, partial [Plasmodium falciparum FCH/4]